MKYGSRKFILAVLVCLCATALLSFHLIDGAQWVTSTGGALLFYNAANVAQRMTGSAVAP